MPEGAVTPVAALACQLLGVDVAMGSNSLLIETYKMGDAQIVDIGIVCCVLTGEILAEIKTVGAYDFSKL